MTRQQKVVYDVVTEFHGHPTAAEVFMHAKQRMPQIGTATVYRNLAMLAEKGQIRRIPVNGEADRFDGVLTPHEHVICRQCGRVRDINVTPEIKSVMKKAGGEKLTVEIILRETCENCLKDTKTADA